MKIVVWCLHDVNLDDEDVHGVAIPEQGGDDISWEEPRRNIDDVTDPREDGDDHYDKEEDDISFDEVLIRLDDPADCQQGYWETKDWQDVAAGPDDLRHGVLVVGPGQEEDVEDQEGHSRDDVQGSSYDPD